MNDDLQTRVRRKVINDAVEIQATLLDRLKDDIYSSIDKFTRESGLEVIRLHLDPHRVLRMHCEPRSSR